jgi:hypothetical protein
LAATPYDPLLTVEGIQAVNGPAAINAILLDSVTTANYEGIWVPWQFVKQGSLELSGSMASLSCQLLGTNSRAPLNSYVITFAGTETTDDVVTVNFVTPVSTLTATYRVLASDTSTSVAAGIGAFINTHANFAAYGLQASNVAGVLTVTWPSYTPSAGGVPWTTSSPPIAPFISVTSSVSGGATETVAVAPGTGGSLLGSAITALGLTQFTFSSRWLKIRVNTLTGGGAVITAIAQGTA